MSFIDRRFRKPLCADRPHSTLGEFFEINPIRFFGRRSIALRMGTPAYAADGKNDAHRETTTHRDFDTVDTHKHGYLTSEDVKSDEYVRKHFAKCNVKHNGHMSREEYANCHE